MLNLRPQPYRSARAVLPSSESTTQHRSTPSSLIASIRILLGITAVIMILTTLGTIFLFHTEDSLHITQSNRENGETLTDHGVHKNIQLHKQILRQHLNQKKASDKNKELTSEREERKKQSVGGEEKQGQVSDIQSAVHLQKGSKLASKDDDETEKVLTDVQPQVKSDVKTENNPALKETQPQVKSDAKIENNPASEEEGDADDDDEDDDIEQETPQNPAAANAAAKPNAKLEQFPPVHLPLARGYSGLPMEKTPALVGAKRGTIECDINVK